MIGLADFPISTLLSPAASRWSRSRNSNACSMTDGRKTTTHPTVGSLFQGVERANGKKNNSLEVTCLITDSRRVVPGALFFAIGGLRTDGNLYLEEAIDRGAVAIVTEQDPGPHIPVNVIMVSDVREALARVSRRFYGKPDARLRISGVTGTNGKTTVTMLTQHLLGDTEKVGLLGTIRYDLGKRTLPSFRTTPESVDLYALLAQMETNGCKETVMEISSHGIDQKRIFGVEMDVVAFLNLTQDHIDYHKSMEEYYEVKKRIFTGEYGRLPEKAVINVDSPYGLRLRKEVGDALSVLTYGLTETADIRAENIELFSDRTHFEIIWPEGRTKVVSPLLGRYNVSNLLAALAIGRANGREMNEMLGRLSGFPGVPGRMERIDCGQPFNVLVDYAHTDDALTHACGMLRDVTSERVIVVFGCGGNRDRTKRVPMLQAVMQGADAVYVTSDNPRSESVERIFDDMRKACEGADVPPVRFIAQRKRAISLALDDARPGDCVLIAGKGHETYQEFEGTVIPFDDRQVAREMLRLKAFDQESREDA